MQHQTLEQLQNIAEISAGKTHPAMTRGKRLERWAELLEREPNRRFATLHQTEYQPIESRGTMRSVGSPISVAFDDPILRAEGLEDDSYDSAKRFFEITDRQLHEIICSCNYGTSMTGGIAARHVRAAMAMPRLDMIAWIRRAISWPSGR